MIPAIFLDRDGVLIHNNPAYIRSWKDVIFYPQALRALSLLSVSNYLIIVVTNQSAISQGLLSLDLANEINQLIVQRVQLNGGRIDRIFMCPHSTIDHCACRKPKPGLIAQASDLYSIDLKQSTLIGDAMSDIMAGQAAGVGKNILVLTGRGEDQLASWDHTNPKTFKVFPDLLHAVRSLNPLSS